MPEVMHLPSLDEIDAEIARRSLAGFVEVTTNFKLEPWQRRDICPALERLLQGKGQRLLIHGPPQFGKSIIISSRFPAYALGKRPDMRVRLATYNIERSTGFTGANLELMQSDQYAGIFPDPAVRVPRVCARDTWSTACRAKLRDAQQSIVALGIRSGFVSQGADLLIVDDPYSGDAEAYSETVRKGVWTWWSDTVLPRLAPETNVVVMFHRWHVDDLAGKLIGQGGWELMRFPALCDGGDDDPTYARRERQIGDPLSPRYPADHLERVKALQGESAFNSLFQGKPVADGGNLLKEGWWRVYQTAPAVFDEVVQSWDMAFKGTEDSDFVVGQVWGRVGASKYLLDQVRAQADLPATLDLVRKLSEKWPAALAKLVEDKANGPAVISMLQREIPGLIAVNPQGGKEARAHAVSPTIEAGNVYLPSVDHAPWVRGFVEECSAFPAGSHDDQVDAMTQALVRLGVNEQQWPAVEQRDDDYTPVQTVDEVLAARGWRELAPSATATGWGD